MGKLTISAARQIELKLGIKQRIINAQENEPTNQSKVIFKKDTRQARDLEIIEEVIQEIMDNRKVSREEAEKILANPM